VHPYLFQIGATKVETYGVVVLVSYAIMVAFAARLARGEGLLGARFAWAVAWATAGTFVGGRIAYVLVNLDWIMSRPSVAMAIWEGGIVSVGGIAGMHAGAAIYGLYARLPFGRILDIAGISGALSMTLGRFACFFAGCDYGRSAPDLPWAIVFTDSDSLVPPELLGVPLHPVQLYLVGVNLLAFLTGLAVYRLREKAGSAFGATAMAYSVARFAVEFFRGDVDRGIWFDGLVSTAQVVNVAWFAIGAVALVTAGRGVWTRGESEHE